ncbi:MAG: 30S ribosomal protein S4 [Elusimicrobiales bacterium]|nr:30S ribosomal protein S4 [Elusimicrobiales bacterium]
MKYTQPSCKRCRSLNEKLFLKGDKCYSNCTLEKRKNSIRQRKLSDYGKHLREKQIAKMMYLMSERQFKRYFDIASKTKGKTGETLLRLLELRLDNIVRRIGFSSSIKHARQLVNHGHIKVNGKVLNIPSYIVKEGDEISLSSLDLLENPLIKKSIEESESKGWRPSWISYDAEKKSAKIIRMPERTELNSKINEQLIVEFYSK